jgi:hypothetical protein
MQRMGTHVMHKLDAHKQRTTSFSCEVPLMVCCSVCGSTQCLARYTQASTGATIWSRQHSKCP